MLNFADVQGCCKLEHNTPETTLTMMGSGSQLTYAVQGHVIHKTLHHELIIKRH